jgi:hypothetical protein
MKINIKICEKVKFEHEATIEVPEGIDIEEMLDKAEREDQLDDVLYVLEEKYKCKMLEISRDNDGADSEIEIDDYEKI